MPFVHLGHRQELDAFVMFIGLNPSTADEVNDDPTVRRCIDFSKRWGYGALCMTNIFAWRDTDPEGMKLAVDPVGPRNDDELRKVAAEAGVVVAAWGNHGAHLGRGAAVLRLLSGICVPQALHVNKDGSPSHPLYLSRNFKPVPLSK